MYRTFWMVFGTAVGSAAPTFRHHTEIAARTEAERLARIHRGATFFVLESVGGCRATDIEWKACDENADLPF